MVKYVDNVWHAVKVSFAHEIGNVCKPLGIDSHRVMEIFCQDTKLNISPKYLRPGFAFGGSCLPTDVRALVQKGRERDLELPLLEAVLPSNEVHYGRGLAMILKTGRKRIGILGFSFKAGTDDLRESPLVGLIEALLGKGCALRIYDRHVHTARLFGANREYIEKAIPHVSSLMCQSLDEVLEHAEVVVVGNRDPEFATVPDRLRPGQQLIDLVRVRPEGAGAQGEGICW
ncbi:MAG TPA: UDP binding domain-containing protein, partial [Geminicoccaceae bacterium]